MKAAMKPNTAPLTLTVMDSPLTTILYISITIESRMIGIDIRKENLPASFLSAPDNNPAQIVDPERDIPGKTASPCAMPIIKACLKEN